MSRIRRTGVSFLMFFTITAAQSLASTWPTAAHTWGGSSTDYGAAVAFDSAGNLYVAGATQSFGAGQGDALILKYSPSGQLLWTRTWGGNGDEYSAAIKFGPDGYLYLTGGTSSYGAGWYDLFVLKLDTDGNLVWGSTWGGGSFEGGHDIGFDATGNIYVVGESYSTSPCCSAILLKFSPSGTLLNQTFYKGPATYDSGYSLTVDANFNVIIVGISWDYGYNPLHNSILLVKYDPNGNLLWQENWSTPFPAQDESWAFHAVTTDNSGNIYLGGRHSMQCQNSNFGQCDFDALLLKLDSNGNFLWANTWGATGTYDTSGSVLLNVSQAPLVAGIKDDFGTPSLFLLGYDSNGNLLSQNAWQGGNIQLGSAAGMVFDASGTPYIASSALNNIGSWSPTTANSSKLSSSLISNSYTVGNATLGTTQLTTPTIDQPSGVQDIGGGGADAFVSQYPNAGFLSFPLPNRTATTAKIVSVFDHSSGWQYCADGTVTAYDGEQGSLHTDHEPTHSFCSLTGEFNVLYAFSQPNGQSFSVNGQYVGLKGDGAAEFLQYDGHPGFDFATTDQSIDGKIPVFAAADGKVVCSNVPSSCMDSKTADPCVEGPGEIKIQHSNGYFSIYLHLSSSFVSAEETVSSGQQIGISGATGTPQCSSPHLHFEVRKEGPSCNPHGVCTCNRSETETGRNCIPVDPYGWTGAPGADPYKHGNSPVQNINLWK